MPKTTPKQGERMTQIFDVPSLSSYFTDAEDLKNRISELESRFEVERNKLHNLIQENNREYANTVIKREAAELRAAQWEAMVRRGWRLSAGRSNGLFYIHRGSVCVAVASTEQAAIDAAFEREPLVQP